MGACISCLPHLFSRADNRRASVSGDSGSRCWRRCRLVISCCGMCDALFPTADEQGAISGPLLQPTDNSSEARCSHTSLPETRHASSVSSSLRQEKVGTNLLQTQIGETHYRNSSGSGHYTVEQCKIKEYEKDQKPNTSELLLASKKEKLEAITSLLDDDDICPTCLDGYDEENPKILTECGHHFHLACILEWMERSSHCPLCDKEMVIIETS